MIRWLYETVTGTPWTTGRCMAAEFGSPPGVRYATELAGLSDQEVLAYGYEIIAAAQAAQQTVEVKV